ncbi:uncharacterized protein A4U43_C09F6500 [Asparagus officinalis]|uniref:Uncharacterized protein n=1 Tax=Asparagus officinalis TaxID=4686 RepID=A0A5P1E932_ASPOF|nr:uncharacterized protein A4U43_C09F6500 [Asparagus officinalis]
MIEVLNSSKLEFDIVQDRQLLQNSGRQGDQSSDVLDLDLSKLVQDRQLLQNSGRQGDRSPGVLDLDLSKLLGQMNWIQEKINLIHL